MARWNLQGTDRPQKRSFTTRRGILVGLAALAVLAVLWVLAPGTGSPGDRAGRAADSSAGLLSPAVAAPSVGSAGPAALSGAAPALTEGRQGVTPSGKGHAGTKGSPLPAAGQKLLAESQELSRLDRPGASADRLERVRILRTSMKYPLVRVQEEVNIDSATGREELLRFVAMSADHVIVKLRPGFGEDDLRVLAAKYEGKIRAKKPLSGLYLVELAAHEAGSVPSAVAQYRQEIGVIALAEPDYVVFAADDPPVIPNDTRFGELWGMHNTGQTNGTVDADIDAAEAWSICTGSRSVLVGVIDTGVDYTHPDLQANCWTNTGECGLDGLLRDKRSNGVDDDGNGYVDDWRGWNFITETNDPKDDHFHGTHCSGTIGGVGSNALGVAGVCWQVSVVGLKFLSSGGSGYISDATEATVYATRIRCALTSNSWGGGGYSQAMLDAIAEAGRSNILFVAAAGNSAQDADTSPMYPAAYPATNIISVAATTRNDELASFSNYGALSVDLGAPGHEILSTYPTYMTSAMQGRGDPTNYNAISGTSMATPHVAGACALLKSFDPAFSAMDIKTYLMRSVDLVPALDGMTLTGGRLNVHRPLQWRRDGRALLVVAGVSIDDGSLPGTVGNTNGIVEVGERVAITVNLRNSGTSASTNGVARLETMDDLPAAIFVDGSVDFGSVAGGATTALGEPFLVEFSASYEAAYTAKLKLVVEEADGITWTEPLTIEVRFVPKGGAVAWGSGSLGNPLVGDWNGQSTPVGIWQLSDGVQALFASSVSGHCLALKTNGMLWAWGGGTEGQLGRGTNETLQIPAQIPGFSNVTTAAVGGSHSLALKADGTVWAWGANSSGQLGDGTTNRVFSPQQVPGLTNICSIAAGSDYSLAAQTDGSVWTWGANNYGQLGDGSTNKSLVPLRSSTLSGVSAVAAGGSHGLALKTNGTVWAWGYNSNGQLGDGTTTQRNSPVQCLALSGIRRLASGYYHNLAVKSDGTVWGWGYNSYGQCGGSGATKSTPGQVSGLAGVTNAAAGYWHSLVAKTNGTVWAWGYGYYGQLGTGITGWDATSTTPVQTTNLTGIVGVAAQGFGSMAWLPGGEPAANRPPGIQNGDLWMAEDSPATCANVAFDPDNDPVTYQMTLLPQHGTVTGTPPHMVYWPNTNFFGSDEFRYKATDGEHDSNEAKISVTVWAVNDAPIIQSGPTAVPSSALVDQTVDFSVTATDVESEPLTYLWDLGDAVTGATDHVTHAYHANGVYLASVVISDGVGGLSTGTVTVTVTGGTNWAPVATNESYTLVEDTPLTVSAPGVLANDSDPDADPLTSILVTDPAHGAVVLNPNGSFTYTPTNNYNGADSFVYKPNDGKADGNFGTVSLTITPVNDAPVASNTSVAATEDQTAWITMVATDVEWNSLTYTVLSNPSNGTLSGSGSWRQYTPAANYNGPDSFTFKVNDGLLDSNTGTVSITVASVNDVPTLTMNGAPTTGILPLPVAFTATSSDADGDALSFSWTFGDGDTSTNQNPTHTYTNMACFTARVTVSDGKGGSVSATRQVMVDEPDGLTAHWRLDESEGTNAVDSAAGNNGAVTGSLWTAGVAGGGLWFDGTNDSMSVVPTRYGGIADTFTLALWVNPSESRASTVQATSGVTGTSAQRYSIFPPQGDSTYGAGHAGVGISVGTNGVSVFEHASSYLPSVLVTNMPLSGWTHVAVVYDNRLPKLYVNGAWVKDGLAGTKTTHPGANLGGTSYGWYQGHLDDVRIYNYALPAWDVAALASGDWDGDWMPDAWEVAHFGDTNAVHGGAEEDWDGDGMGNLREYRAGTNPTNSQSLLTITGCQAVEGTNLVIRWQSAGGKFYALQRSTNVTAGFSEVATNRLTATPPFNVHTTVVNQAGPRYYRVAVEP